MNMPKILAIETATKVCSVAMMGEGEILGEMSLNIPQVHVERLVVMINDLLRNLHWNYEDLDGIAVSNGPGSFTGLRIGLSVAKGIAFGLDKSLIAIPTLEAIAYSIIGFAEDKIIVPILHSRAEEFYFASFKLLNKRTILIGDYGAANAEEIVEKFSAQNKNNCGYDPVFVGEGVNEFSKNEVVKKRLVESSMRNLQASARNVALLAAQRFDGGDFADMKSLVPLYVKDFVPLKKRSFRNFTLQKSGA